MRRLPAVENTMTRRPDRTELAPGLAISRIITGLWQIADIEKDGSRIDLDKAASQMADYAAAGFDTFDMADHYGSAEDVAGRFHASYAGPSALFTKWCPPPGPMTPDIVRAAVDRARGRLKTDSIDLMQLHWWMFQHPGWIDAMKGLQALRGEGPVRHIGVTNFDTDHLRLLVVHGFPIVSNQVCFSLLDRRAAEEMSAFCVAHGVRLIAYGALAGGLLTDKWRGQPEPSASDIADWSTMKYKRFVDAIGGWGVLQGILAALAAIARKHGVSIANVSSRWVLEHKAVAGIIVGARLGESEHRADNLRVFDFALDEEDRGRIDRALAATKRIPGDCGDEYRRPPFLTASGDLSHHPAQLPKVYAAEPMPERPGRLRVSTGSVWEPLAGYSRAVRVGNRILVSGTTATHGAGEVICPNDPHGQAVYILDKIEASIEALGGSLADVIRTRVYLKDRNRWEEVSRVHGRALGHVRPANTLIEAKLVGDYEVEIEAEAVVEPRETRA
jgi:aryl-alcohol dehydrogenase-like predicted oxidoreductase/enamine deaminase RidA (YjgF/YER057c/UK114 family)